MRVIGTAGHVDHGKSTLVQALTGIHPDRLKEEQEREMTIDLGFAWMTLPSTYQGGEKEEIGIVDVPGHRDFIENMLAGIGGIDAALFVVAADEGVMPQTREHLAILNILDVQGGVVALTKVDIISDPEWIDLVETDLGDVLAGTVLQSAQVIRVSGKTGQGIEELKVALSNCLAERPPRPDLNRPRLPVDRVFTIPGFGTVVTGTLTDGHLRVSDEVVILPEGHKGRVRGLQTHKRKEDSAVPGSRTAVNISGVSLDEIKRGDIIAHPGDYKASQRLDLRFNLLPDAHHPVRHNTEVKLFIGAAEVLARLRLLGSEELRPGESGWLQVEPYQPIVAVRGDRYILRRPSPGETLGGGVVVDPTPKWRHRRFSPEVLQRLEALDKGTPADILFQALLGLGAASLKDVVTSSNLDQAAANQAIQELISNGQILNLEDQGNPPVLPSSDDLFISKGLWEQISARAIQDVDSYHTNYPLRPGIKREELKSRLNHITKRDTRLFNASMRILVAGGKLTGSGPLVMLPEHKIQFTPEQQKQVDALLARFAASPYAPPTVKDCQEDVGDAVFTAMVDLGQLVAVSPEVVFRFEEYESIVADLRQLLGKQGTITVAQVRDHFKTSRRYVLAIMEHLDAIGVTVRDGDSRRLKS